MATRAEVIIGGDVAPLRQVLREGVQSVQQFASSTNDSLKTVGGGADLLRSKFGLLMTTLTGGAFGAFISKSIDMMDHLDETSQKVGLTTEALSELAYAAKFASLDTDDLTKTLVKMSGTLQDAKEGQKEAVELFRRLKLDPTNVKDADQLLMELADRFGRMPDGVAKTSLAIDVFGEKLGPKLLPLLADGRAGLERLRKEAHDLGVVIDSNTAAAAARLNDQMDRVKTAGEGVWNSLATKLLPGLASLADMWAENVKQGGLFAGTLTTIQERLKQGLGIDKLSRAEGTLRALSGRMSVLVNEIERLQGVVDANPNAVLGATVGPDGHGPMRAVDRIRQLRGEYERTAKVADQLRTSILDTADAMEGKKSAGGGRGNINPGMAAPEPFQPEPKKPTPTTNKAAKGQMDMLDALLAKERQALIETGMIREYEAAQELDFWKRKLQQVNLSADDRLKVERKVAQLSYEVKKKSLEQERALQTTSYDQEAALQLAMVETAAASNKAMLDAEMITKAQFLQIELGFEEERKNIQAAALVERLKLLADDPTSDPALVAKAKAQLLELEEKYQQKRFALMGDLTKEAPGGGGLSGLFEGTLGNVKGNLGSAFDGAGASFSGMLDGLLTRTQTWAQSVGNLFKGVRDAFVKNVITEPLGRYVTGLAQMLAAKLGFIGQENAAQALGSATTMGIKATETTGVVAANAAQAGAGAAASQASIPYVGPILALAAMAAVFAAVSGLGSRKSAAKGYDIPTGINPVTQLHEEEMVLPRTIANPIRDLIAGGYKGGGGESGGVVHYYDQSGRLSDAEIERKARKIADTLNRTHRNGWRPGR